MRPEIEAYLREHGSKYTTEALRKQLIAAGHDPAEIDAALREMEARGPQLAEARAIRSRFWRWAIGLHVAALAVATVWLLLGATSADYVWIVVVVLGVVLLIGLGLSGLIGRALLGRGMAVALVAPLISALLLGGTCMAMSGPVLI
ncbi:MAG: hypothetical protein ACRDGV_12630 [Candidatus Limnocylindria bacterium]